MNRDQVRAVLAGERKFDEQTMLDDGHGVPNVETSSIQVTTGTSAAGVPVMQATTGSMAAAGAPYAAPVAAPVVDADPSLRTVLAADGSDDLGDLGDGYPGQPGVVDPNAPRV